MTVEQQERTDWRPTERNNGSERLLVHVRPRIAAAALAVVAAMLALASVAQHVLFSGPLPVDKLNLDSEISLPTWFQSAALLLAAGLMALIALACWRGSRRYLWHWIFAAAALVWLSIDEALALHEALIHPVGSALDVGGGGIFYFAWVIPGGVVAVLFAVAYARFVLDLPGRVRRLVVIAGALYLTGVLGFELIGGAYASKNGVDNLPFRLITDVEEVFEMSGQIVLVYALLLLLSRLQVSVRAAGH